MSSLAFSSGMEYWIKTAQKNGTIRKRVEVLLYNNKGKVLAGINPRYNSLSFPGGGIDKGETLPLAGIRESLEETGFSSSKMKPLKGQGYSATPRKEDKKKMKHKFHSSSKTNFVYGPSDIKSKEILNKDGDKMMNVKFMSIDRIIKKLEEKKNEGNKHIHHIFNAQVKALRKLRDKIRNKVKK